MQLPAAGAINSAVRAAFDPLVRPLGFAPKKGGSPAWYQNEDPGDEVHFQFRRHPKAVDIYQGGRFILGFQHNRQDLPGSALSGEANFDQLLTRSELESVLAYQRQVISSLPRPPEDWVASYPESLRGSYLRGFDPLQPHSPGDLWLRYQTMEHIHGWLRLIGALLPSILDRARHLDPQIMYLGSEIDIDSDPARPITRLPHG
jgi:hypothetical protein